MPQPSRQDWLMSSIGAEMRIPMALFAALFSEPSMESRPFQSDGLSRY